MGLNELACAEIKLAVSEICNNTIKHANGGICTIATKNNNKILEVVVSDSGNGIGNIEIAMKKGFSSIKSSLGIGLDVAERSVDKFEISSTPSKGTKIVLQKFLPLSEEHIQFGVVSLPDESYNFNGDAFLIKEFDGDKVLMAIIDGLGQGHKASVYSSIVKEAIIKYYEMGLPEIIQHCDVILKDSEFDGGVAMSLLLISPNEISFCGLGDTHCYFQNENGFELLFQIDGLVGNMKNQVPKLIKKETTNDFNVVLCTDGISSKLNAEALNWDANAQQIAYEIFNKFHKSHGDVSVLLAKCNCYVQ